MSTYLCYIILSNVKNCIQYLPKQHNWKWIKIFIIYRFSPHTVQLWCVSGYDLLVRNIHNTFFILMLQPHPFPWSSDFLFECIWWFNTIYCLWTPIMSSALRVVFTLFISLTTLTLKTIFELSVLPFSQFEASTSARSFLLLVI